METGVVGAEGNEEAKVEENAIGMAGYTEHIDADPVVYKLVRVDGDGRLVPATDDEIMVVEDLLEDDKSELFVKDTGQTVECAIDRSCSIEKSHSESLMEGTLASDKTEAVTRNLNVECELAVNKEKQTIEQEEFVPPLASGSGHSSVGELGSLEGCSNVPGGKNEKKSRSSAIGSSSKPDFSKLTGELHLDNLTVKELQETFKATFGRETSVKDKQWLKRRIVMGLTHSCDFSATSLVIKDGKVVKKGKERVSKIMDDNVSKDPVDGIVNETCGCTSISHDNQMEDHSSSRKDQDSSMEYNSIGEDLNVEQRATKRVRKPTKRYIEELSEVESQESSGKLISSNKFFPHGQLLQQANVRSVPNFHFNRPLVTRQDSLGGSGVQVPYVSRIRRGRPREDIAALVKPQPYGIGMAAAGLVEQGLAINSSRLDDKDNDEVIKSRVSPGQIQQSVNQHHNRRFVELKASRELQTMDSFADSSDDNAVPMSMPQCGMRRKHHRPWTLNEVVKLVEGVAKYGAGRWSEIKRVAFASSHYRTSVDLKDKWRNLLRASFAQLPAEKGMQNSRKHSSVPIPAPILMRVRELAEIHAQVPPVISSSKFAGHNNKNLGRIVHDARSGYL